MRLFYESRLNTDLVQTYTFHSFTYTYIATFQCVDNIYLSMLSPSVNIFICIDAVIWCTQLFVLQINFEFTTAVISISCEIKSVFLSSTNFINWKLKHWWVFYQLKTKTLVNVFINILKRIFYAFRCLCRNVSTFACTASSFFR